MLEGKPPNSMTELLAISAPGGKLSITLRIRLPDRTVSRSRPSCDAKREHREQVIEDSLRGSPQAKAAWPRSTSLENITRDVAAINVPTLVIAGELDRVDSFDLLKAELLSRVPQADLHVLRDTGHLRPARGVF